MSPEPSPARSPIPKFAFVRGVRIVVRNTATNAESQRVTLDTGQYRISNHAPGSYSLDAEARGFVSRSPLHRSLGARILNIGNPLNAQFGGAVFGSVIGESSDANSSYHSLQISATRRFSHGFEMSHAYPWGHANDNTPNGNPVHRFRSAGTTADRTRYARRVGVMCICMLSFGFPLSPIKSNQDGADCVWVQAVDR
jgi:hypothetical protein